MAYEILFAPQTYKHLQYLSVREQRILLDAIEDQLQYEPMIATQNRKLLRPNPYAPWELRVGDLRALYDVNRDDEQVNILVIGRKVREKFIVAGQEIKL